ncbi:MAG: ThiF family adenylyltransferase, partial [Halieaceae bacterium]|nr:ThiF family adenylyltransferase [Halieaceae bacterium]
AAHLAGEALSRAVAAVDLVVDATDNFIARLAVNRACIAAGKPLVSGAAIGSEGQVTVFDTAAGSPCYRCLYPEGSSDPPLSCSENGVLAPIVGIIGSLQALEAVKYLSGFGEGLAGRMLLVDGRTLDVRQLRLSRNPECPDCKKPADA